MAISYFRNDKPYSLTIPSYSSTLELYPGQYVASYSYYDHLANLGILTNTGGTAPTPANLLVYIFPDGPAPTGGGGSGAVDSIIAGSGITVDQPTGNVTVSLSAGAITNSMLAGSITAAKIASGQVVKSLNGLFDNITLAVGSNLTLTPSGQTLTLAAPTIGFTILNPTAPLVLTSSGGGSTINGSIAITATNDGGAIAKQTSGSHLTQTGVADINSLFLSSGFLGIESSVDHLLSDDPAYIYVKNLANDHYLYHFVDSLDVNLGYLSKTGLNYAKSFDGLTATLATSLAVGAFVTLSATPFFAVDTTFKQDIILDQSSSLLGRLLGTANTNTPFIELTPTSTSIPAIKIHGDVAAPTKTVLNLLDTDNITSLARLSADGTFKAKTLQSDNFTLKARLITAGAYNLSTFEGTSFGIDTSSGAVTITLPLLDANSKNLMYTFTKINIGGSNILISGTSAQTINGVTSKLITTEFTPVRLIALISEDVVPTVQYIEI